MLCPLTHPLILSLPLCPLSQDVSHGHRPGNTAGARGVHTGRRVRRGGGSALTERLPLGVPHAPLWHAGPTGRRAREQGATGAAGTGADATLGTTDDGGRVKK